MRFNNEAYSKLFPPEPVTEVVETPVATFKPQEQTETPVEPVQQVPMEVNEDGSNGDDPGDNP